MKLVTFDFWNTLFLDRDEGVRHKKRIAFAYERISRHRPTVSLEEVGSAFAQAHTLFSTQWDLRRSVTMNRHFSAMLQHLDLQIPENDANSVVDYFETILLEYPPVLIEKAAEAVQHASADMRVGLISDTGYSPGRTLVRILEAHGLGSYFQAFSFSNETGVLKPSSEAFLKILRELDVKPEEAVHIGDLEDTDIAGAKAIGMKAIKYIGSNPSAVRESRADAVIESFGELPSALAGLV
jgi:putative hydrolase of the HAD superfamily